MCCYYIFLSAEPEVVAVDDTDKQAMLNEMKKYGER